MYTVLSSGYSTAKTVWAAGKDYRLVGAAESMAESVAGKLVAATSSYTRASTLREADVLLRPALLSADVAVSPYIERSVKYSGKTAEDLEPVLAVARKVLPVKTVASLYAFWFGLFTATMERVGKAMMIEAAPETKLE
jgi:hypothetical protein